MPPRKNQEAPHVLGPKGRHGFSWGLPHVIYLPYPLPRPATGHGNGNYWAMAENIVAAYNAGFAAAAVAERLPEDRGRARSALDKAA